MRVPILKIPYRPEHVSWTQEKLAEILTSGAMTLGKYTKQFEEQFAAFCGTKYAIACSNGTSALEIILRALEVEGASVIVPTNTFLATAYGAMHAGNRVIFADSDPETFALDPADVERKIQPDTKAVILVHIGGLMTPAMQQLKDLCAKRGLYLIEDCAHAHGSTWNGQVAGSIGVAAGFSFFPTKVFVTGEGGMMTTNDEAIYKAAIKIRNHGKDPAQGNRMAVFGHNLRISEITAALGVEQMNRAGEIVAARQGLAAEYDRLLANQTLLRPVKPAAGTTSTYYKYLAYLPEGCARDKVKATLKEKFGVALTGEVYADLCHTEPLWQKYDAAGHLRTPKTPASHVIDVKASYPGAERLAARHVCLPLYPDLTKADAAYVVESVNTVVMEQVGSAV